MKVLKVIPGLVAAFALAGGLSVASPAAAQDALSPGAAAALGVLGGMAVGGAIASSRAPVYGGPVYAPPPRRVYYAPEPVYYAPAPPPVYRRCFTERSREWVPGWGWQPARRTICR